MDDTDEDWLDEENEDWLDDEDWVEDDFPEED